MEEEIESKKIDPQWIGVNFSYASMEWLRV